MALSQEARDREAQAVLEAKLLEKLARADIIAEQRASIAEELQRMRKDIAQQEAWVKVGVSFCLLRLGDRETLITLEASRIRRLHRGDSQGAAPGCDRRIVASWVLPHL